MKRLTKTASIEFFVDEAADLLLAFENPEEGASEQVLRIPLTDVRAREPMEMQRALGRLVLSFLNSRSSRGLNLPRDLEDENKLDEQHFAELQAMADKKTPEAIYDLGVGLISRGISNNHWADIEQGEAYLKEAIAAGHPAAIKYQVEVWALARPRLEQKLRRPS